MAERQLDLALVGWPSKPFYVQHWYDFFGRCELALYRDQIDLAQGLVDRNARDTYRSLLTQVELVRSELEHIRGRVALRQARADGGSHHLTVALQAAKRCEGIDLDLSLAFGRLLRAGVAIARGQPGRACELLREANIYFESTGALFWSAATTRVLGGILGSGEGRALIEEADQRYASFGVRDTERITRLLAPGFD